MLPVLVRVKEVYVVWFNLRETMPKKSRYTLGDKIDKYFLDILELLNIATYQKTEDKIPTLRKAILRLDSLKFFLMISWEVRLFDTQKYTILSEHIHELGKMIGGWKKGLETKITH